MAAIYVAHVSLGLWRKLKGHAGVRAWGEGRKPIAAAPEMEAVNKNGSCRPPCIFPKRKCFARAQQSSFKKGGGGKVWSIFH